MSGIKHMRKQWIPGPFPNGPGYEASIDCLLQAAEIARRKMHLGNQPSKGYKSKTAELQSNFRCGGSIPQLGPTS